MKMLMSTSDTTASLLLPPSVRIGGQKQNEAHTGPNRVCMQALPSNIKRGKLQIDKSQTRSRHMRCAAALNATCAAALTQTVAPETKTAPVVPDITKTPPLEDNGPGLPPIRDDGNGGNGGGGGGNFSGGLALLGILGVLDVLKDIEKEWRSKDLD